MRLAVSTSVDAENPVEGDLLLVGGDLVWATDLALQVSLRLRARLAFFQGEWFLDTREGTPHYQRVMGKGATDATLRAVFTSVVRGTPGIATVEWLRVSRDRPARELALVFSARLDNGKVFSSQDFGPFIATG